LPAADDLRCAVRARRLAAKGRAAQPLGSAQSLLVGSEIRLGILVTATWRLVPRPRHTLVDRALRTERLALHA
jgi:hypothetical protein